MVGYYTEILFEQKGIRFIAVNDMVDSKQEGDEFTPFRNIINEWYAKDTSKRSKPCFVQRECRVNMSATFRLMVIRRTNGTDQMGHR